MKHPAGLSVWTPERKRVIIIAPGRQPHTSFALNEENAVNEYKDDDLTPCERIPYDIQKKFRDQQKHRNQPDAPVPVSNQFRSEPPCWALEIDGLDYNAPLGNVRNARVVRYGQSGDILYEAEIRQPDESLDWWGPWRPFSIRIGALPPGISIQKGQ